MGKPAGSPAAGEPVFLMVGKVRRPHGLHGEVVVEIITDFPERLHSGKIVYIGENHTRLTIQRQRPFQDGLLLSFEDFSTPEQVSSFRNKYLYVDKTTIAELPSDEFYFHQLLGLTVITDTGETLGSISDILQTGANDVYVVSDKAGREILLPAIQDVIMKVDLAQKIIRVHLLPGLLSPVKESE